MQPMKHVFTPENADGDRFNVTDEKDKKKKQLPGKLAMAFVMQFARAYHVEQQLPLELSGFMLN
jgi:hypothetical protein